MKKLKNYNFSENFFDYLSKKVYGDKYFTKKQQERNLPTLYHIHGERWDSLLSIIDEWEYSYNHSSYGLPNIGYYHPDGWRLVSNEGYLYILCDEYGGGAPSLWGKCRYFGPDIDLCLEKITD